MIFHKGNLLQPKKGLDRVASHPSNVHQNLAKDKSFNPTTDNQYYQMRWRLPIILPHSTVDDYSIGKANLPLYKAPTTLQGEAGKILWPSSLKKETIGTRFELRLMGGRCFCWEGARGVSNLAPAGSTILILRYFLG